MLEAMAKHQISSIDLPDGYAARVRWWRPDKPRGAVLFFHGIQSHGGWYEESGARLAAAGLTVLMPDRRGSGLNPPPRGHFESADQCMADTRHLLDALLTETGFKAAHIVGVSWGGKQAVLLAQQRPKLVQSLSLIAPGLFPHVDLTRGEKFRVAMSMINDRERMFDIPLNDPRLFTENPERIGFVRTDPLKLTQVSASFLLASRRLDKEIRGFDRCPYRGPIHLFLAGRDQIIDNEQTRRWLRELPSPNRQITEYRQAQHTLEFEPDPDPFFTDLVEWIVARGEG